MAVRMTTECHCDAPPRTPFCRNSGTSPRESMSLDSQSPTAPYESSSFATLKGKRGFPVLTLAPLWGAKVESGTNILRPLEGERAAAAARGCSTVRIVNDCIGKQAAGWLSG